MRRAACRSVRRRRVSSPTRTACWQPGASTRRKCSSSRSRARRCESTRTSVPFCIAWRRSTCPSSRRISRASTTARAGTRTFSSHRRGERRRGTACDRMFVLAHTNDAERLLPVLARAIYDPAGGVRNNAMRVLMQMAPAHPELEFPVRDLVAAFDFPSSSDRNKSGYTLAALAAQPRYSDAIRAGAVPVALRVLRLARTEQPRSGVSDPHAGQRRDVRRSRLRGVGTVGRGEFIVWNAIVGEPL